MTSTTYLEMEAQAHSALATTGRIRAAFAGAGEAARTSAYFAFQVFRMWRKMRTLAKMIKAPLPTPPADAPPRKVNAEALSHSLALMRELHEIMFSVNDDVRRIGAVRSLLCRPWLRGIERANETLGEFLDDIEMSLSPELRASVRQAIDELKPPTGTDWRASLEAMRH